MTRFPFPAGSLEWLTIAAHVAVTAGLMGLALALLATAANALRRRHELARQ